MAHRQLLHLLLRPRNPAAPLPRSRFGSSRSSRSSYPLSPQIGQRFFSTASKHGSGKSTHSEKTTSAPQKKPIPPTPLTPKAAPQVPQTPQAAQAPQAPQGTQPQSKESPREPGSTPKQSYFMIVAALSAAAIAIVTLYPMDLRKVLHLGQKEEHRKDEQNLEKKTVFEETVVLGNQTLNEKDENALVEPKVILIDEVKELQGNERESAENFLHQESTANVILDGSMDDQVQTRSEDVPLQSATVVNEEQELQTNEISQESNIAETVEELPVQDSVPDVILDGIVTNQVQEDSEVLHKIPSEPDTKAREEHEALHIIPEKLESAILSGEEKEPIHEVPKTSKEISKSESKRPNVIEAYNLQVNGAKTAYVLDEDLPEHEASIKPDSAPEMSTTDGQYPDSAKNAFDILDMIHAAEQRQAEIDAYLYEEALKKIKLVLQQEIKDAQAKELMYAEEANRLGQEIELEREKAAAALRAERELSIERLNQELKRKEEETSLKLEKGDLLAKAEITAAIAKEKALHLNDVKDVKREVEALRMVFHARSEEVRLSLTAHKLAVGTFALEDAMKNGASVEKVIDLIFASYGGRGSDPLLDAALSSLPKKTQTIAQLHQKFESMKGAILELSLIPASGGGFLSHAAAKVTSFLKMKEEGRYADGIDSVVSQVQRCLSDGKLVDAVDLIEKSVKGTEAEILVADWVKQARDRAVMEQVLLLLQAHATAIVSSLT